MSALPPVVGINLGNSYASIAVFTKERVAECIANQDGERQIACAIAFIGQEVYIGNQAKPHLVKNAKNTIQGFRDLLGVSYADLPRPFAGMLVPHPDDPTAPAWKVEVLQPAPSPLPQSVTSNPSTAHASPNPSALATPASEPVTATRYITPLEATTLFLRSLAKSAEDFLGKSLTGAVVTVPSSFTPSQRSALLQAAKDASVPVLQLLDEAGAAALTTLSPTWSPSNPLPQDRTQLIIDVGHSSTTLTLLSLRAGLILPLSSTTQPIGGHTLDSLLLKHFCTEFTKKTKTPLDPKDPSDGRSIQKLLLALEHTKRTISASSGTAASLSIESLKAGIDFTTTINRMRFDLLARPFYTSISAAVASLLEQGGGPSSSSSSKVVDVTTVDEIVYVGGTASLPGLDEHLMVACGFKEEVEDAFKRGDVVGGGVGDPTTVLSRGCAYQALLVNELVQGEEKDLLKAFEEGQGNGASKEVSVTSRTVALVFPSAAGARAENGTANANKSLVDELTKSAGGTYIPLILKETPLPARRVLDLSLVIPADHGSKVVMEVWEVEEDIKIEKRKPLKDIDEDEEEEEEEEEVKHDIVNKMSLLGVLELAVKGKRGGGAVLVNVSAVRSLEGGLVVEASQAGNGKALLQI
ncbi:Hsp70 protein-domain-containing protein [Amanita rubescens]|nr:Hsp70 protein-domain-containing protein [Amanita rubescens]